MPKYTQEQLEQFKQKTNERWIRLDNHFRLWDETTTTKELSSAPIGAYCLRPGAEEGVFFLSIKKSRETIQHLLFRLTGCYISVFFNISADTPNRTYQDLNQFIEEYVNPLLPSSRGETSLSQLRSPGEKTICKSRIAANEAKIIADDRFRLWNRDEVENALLKEGAERAYFRPGAGINFVLSYRKQREERTVIEHTLFRAMPNGFEFVSYDGIVLSLEPEVQNFLPNTKGALEFAIQSRLSASLLSLAAKQTVENSKLNAEALLKRSESCITEHCRFHLGNRNDVEKILSEASNGTYFFRKSSIDGHFVLSHRITDTIEHILLKCTNNGIEIVDENRMALENGHYLDVNDLLSSERSPLRVRTRL